VTVGKEVPFEIITAGAGPGQAKVTVNSPSGKPVPALTTAKTDGFNSKFIPLEKGAYSVQVTFADQPVPQSPFTITATEVQHQSPHSHSLVMTVTELFTRTILLSVSLKPFKRHILVERHHIIHGNS